MDPHIPNLSDPTLYIPELPVEYKKQLDETISNITKGKDLYVTDDGEIVQSSKIFNIWEKTKGWFGGIDHTDRELIKLRIINVINQGIDNEWITFSDEPVIREIEKRYNISIPDFNKVYFREQKVKIIIQDLKIIQQTLKDVYKIYTENLVAVNNNIAKLKKIVASSEQGKVEIRELLRQHDAIRELLKSLMSKLLNEPDSCVIPPERIFRRRRR